MAEWAASLNMPSEPVSTPVSSLSSVTTPAAMTEKIAAERLAACGVLDASSRMAVWLMEEMVQQPFGRRVLRRARAWRPR